MCYAQEPNAVLRSFCTANASPCGTERDTTRGHGLSPLLPISTSFVSSDICLETIWVYQNLLLAAFYRLVSVYSVWCGPNFYLFHLPLISKNIDVSTVFCVFLLLFRGAWILSPQLQRRLKSVMKHSFFFLPSLVMDWEALTLL